MSMDMLFGDVPDFDGESYEPERDHDRLASHLVRVHKLMEDGEWRTLEDIRTALNLPHADVSARLRDLRKRKFGGHTVSRVYLADGVWMYRFRPNPNPEEPQES
jgi:hypothetical protein